MQQASTVHPFTERTLFGSPAAMPAGRWQGMQHGTPVAVPAKRRSAGIQPPRSNPACKAIIALIDGTCDIRFVAGSDPAFVATIHAPGMTEFVAFRTRDEAILTSTTKSQSPWAAVVLAAHLLVDGQSDFAEAYAALLDATTNGAPQDKVNALLETAADEMCFAFDSDLDLMAASWFRQADPATGDFDEAIDTTALPLTPLFSKPDVLARFRAGTAPEYAALGTRGNTSKPSAEGPPIVASDAFIGPQLDVVIRFMKDGQHILYHGPTGTAKSFTWEKAMKAVDPDFDADSYPFFVNGSGGLEDIDFIGQVIKDRDGVTRWVDGPLTLAMRAGKRFKVEELNRMPTAMQSILMGAMAERRIKIPTLGEVIVAIPGFAVDAMANIGQEYTGTESIDPAVMRRFPIKVEYDFLDAKDEVHLLRSRHTTLHKEDAETLVRIANSVRDAYTNGSGDVDVDLYVSPAGLLNSAGLVAGGTTIKEAIDLTWIADVAWSKPHRMSVRALIDLEIRDSRTRKRPGAKTAR